MEGFAPLSYILLSRWNGPGEAIYVLVKPNWICAKLQHVTDLTDISLQNISKTVEILVILNSFGVQNYVSMLFNPRRTVPFLKFCPEIPAFLQAVCGGIEELTDYTLLSKGKKEGKVIS